MTSEREILPGVNGLDFGPPLPPNDWEGVILVVPPKDKEGDKVDGHLSVELTQLIVGSAYASRTHPIQLDLRTKDSAEESQQKLVGMARQEGYATVVAAGDGII